MVGEFKRKLPRVDSTRGKLIWEKANFAESPVSGDRYRKYLRSVQC